MTWLDYDWTVNSWRDYELSKDELGELRVDLYPYEPTLHLRAS